MSLLLALCEGNPSVRSGFPLQSASIQIQIQIQIQYT